MPRLPHTVAATTRAIILAAGAGRRLLPITADRPKVLVEVGGQPMLVRMLRQLAALGVKEATIIVGDRADQVRDRVERAALPFTFEWVFNPEYATTNNSWSLTLASDALRHGGLLIEGDVVADETVLMTLVSAVPDTCWLVRRFGSGMEGAFLQGDEFGRLRRVAIATRGTVDDKAGWKSMGLLKLSPSYGTRLAAWLEREASSGRRDRYYDLVIADHVDEEAPNLVVAEQGFWIEIDDSLDLTAAASALERLA